MKVHLLGVRGSTPVSGHEFLRYGGHTSCVAVTLDGAARPSILLDAGTGLQQLGRALAPQRLDDPDPFDGTVLLSHLHWDHLQGLPFSPFLDRRDATVDIVIPTAAATTAYAALAGVMQPPYFPIAPYELEGDWTFTALPGIGRGAAHFTAGEAKVSALDIPHKGGRTVAYRLEHGGASLVYAPDHALTAGATSEVLDFFAGADLLLHDGQFTADETDIADRYGHSTIPQTLALAARCSVGRLVLIHHAPGRTDDQLDVLAAALAADGTFASIAREGDEIDVAAAFDS